MFVNQSVLPTFKPARNQNFAGFAIAKFHASVGRATPGEYALVQDDGRYGFKCWQPWKVMADSVFMTKNNNAFTIVGRHD